MAAQVVEDGVAAEAVLVEALLADLGGLDLPELVEAQTLGLLHPRSQRAQEVLGRHENLRQRTKCRVQIFFLLAAKLSLGTLSGKENGAVG